MAKRPPPRTSFRTLPSPPENPVLQAELAHLQRTRRLGSGRVLFWLVLLVFVIAVAVGAALYLMGRSGNIVGVELAQRVTLFRHYLFVANSVLAVLALAAGPILVLETLLLGSDSISREQRAGAWEPLVLTRLSAWQIVTGKWRAVQGYLYRHYGGLMLLRAFAFLWINLSWTGSNGFSGPPDAVALFLAACLVVGLLALNIALAGASSLLASFQTGALASFGGAAAVHAAVVLLIAAANVVFFPLLTPFDGYARYAVSGMIAMLLDGGMIVASQVLETGVTALPAVVAVFALFNAALMAALLYALLRLARWLAVRQGAAG